MGQSTDKSGIALFIDTAVRCGMRRVVCSPGSRNAPLVIAMDLHPLIDTYVVHDERSAAFYAMGMAQQSGQAVGVVCTSGSAMLNYYPAVAEAFYQEIPLIVMSADRPEEWVNQGDGQTIVQKGVYTNHIRGEMSISEQVEKHEQAVLQEAIIAHFNLGTQAWKGPLHFNFPISEPMYTLTEWEHQLDPIEHIDGAAKYTLDAAFLEAWQRSERRMILCGQYDPSPALLRLLADLADDSSVAVLVENTSNLVHPRFVHCIDRSLSAISVDEMVNFEPDVLLTLGGAIISKRIKSFLRKSKLKAHCRVAHSFPEMDTFRALTHLARTTPENFIHVLSQAEGLRNRSLFGSRWKALDYRMDDLSADYMKQVPYSDLSVFHTLLDFIPNDFTLHMGNSSVVRYCQLFQPVSSITYRSNRGTSGIDGSLSTACGAAWLEQDRCHLSIIGDVSFFYDSNALWSSYLSSGLRIVVINNGGGGIFRIIDGPSSSTQLEKYFEAKPTGKAEFICQAFDVNYSSAASIPELEELLPDFFKSTLNKRPHLLEIFTPADKNDAVLKHFFNLSSALQE